MVALFSRRGLLSQFSAKPKEQSMLYDVKPRPKEVLVGEIEAAIQRDGFDRLTISKLAGRSRRESEPHTWAADQVAVYDSAMQWFDSVIGDGAYQLGGSFRLRGYADIAGTNKKCLERTFTMSRVSEVAQSKTMGVAQAVEGLAGHIVGIGGSAMRQSTELVRELGDTHRETRDFTLEMSANHREELDDLKEHIMNLTAKNTELECEIARRDALDGQPSMLDPQNLPMLLKLSENLMSAAGRLFGREPATAPETPPPA
jgi:hypothetical protein